MDLRGTKIKNTYGNLLTIGDVAGSNQTGSLYNGEGELVTQLNIQGTISASSMAISDAEVVGNLSVGGTITAQEFYTEYVSSSIIYESGSTKFGDTFDDVHSFTGSLQVSGSTILNSELSVLDISTFLQKVSIQNSADVTGSLIVTGSTQLSGSLDLNLSESGSIFSISEGSDITFDIDEFEMTGSMYVSGSFNIDGDATFTKNLTVQGDITAERFLTEYVTSSVIYESGSTKFGDTFDDVHSFTGSLQVSGSSITTGTSSVYGLLDIVGSANYSIEESGSFVIGDSSDIEFDVDTFIMTGSLLVTGSVEVEGSLTIPTSQSASPNTGSMYFSGSFIYVYDGTQYRSASLS